MSHICFLTDGNSMCKVFNISTLIETVMSFQEFQNKFCPSSRGLFEINTYKFDRCIIKPNLEEYNNEKDQLILIDAYNKFIKEKAIFELAYISHTHPPDTIAFFNCIEQCKLKYPMSKFVIGTSILSQR
jgi:hypothetical protein